MKPFNDPRVAIYCAVLWAYLAAISFGVFPVLAVLGWVAVLAAVCFVLSAFLSYKNSN